MPWSVAFDSGDVLGDMQWKQITSPARLLAQSWNPVRLLEPGPPLVDAAISGAERGEVSIQILRGTAEQLVQPLVHGMCIGCR